MLLKENKQKEPSGSFCFIDFLRLSLSNGRMVATFFEVPYLNFEPRSQSFRTPETKLFQVFSLRRKVFDLVVKW